MMKKSIFGALLGSSFLLLAAFTTKVISQDQEPIRGQQGPPTFAQLLAQMDQNKDGKLAKSEIKGPLLQDFDRVDSNQDGFITEEELKKAPKPPRNQQGENENRPPKGNPQN